MGLLQDKRIIVGVTGSIAAYKSAQLIRFLKQEGAEVQVVMTRAAQEFITPLTLSTLSERPVISDFTESKETGEWTRHVDVALWADLMVVAPCSANTLSAMAHGSCDQFIMAVYLSLRCTCLIAPAMDHDMYLHPTTQSNLNAVLQQGHRVIAPGHGALASGLVGQGRMAEPEEILQAITEHFHPHQPLKGKHALVTAGPTYEAIDPVRFIGNHASGKMGFALAESLADAGAEVLLVTGPTHLHIQRPGIRVMRVQSAEEMWQACDHAFDRMDIAVMAAAVADYRPVQMANEKIKKQADRWDLPLEKTVDIAQQLGSRKQPHQMMVGFALETQQELEHAKDKMIRKRFDMIVMNSLRDAGAGFGVDTNRVALLWPDDRMVQFETMAKSRVAAKIVEEIVTWSQR